MKALMTIAFILTGVVAGKAEAQVWNDSGTWNQQTEDAYAQWVESEVNEDFYLNGKWAGLAHDCADAAYYTRAIFAYENKLPFAMIDPTGSGKTVTNKMTRFNSQSEEKRVRSFLKYIANLSSTKTIGRDTYPVIVNRAYVRPGGIWARPTLMDRGLLDILSGSAGTELPGHAEIIKRIEPTGAIWKLESTVPKAVRALNLTANMWFLPENPETGLRKWLTPEQYGLPFNQLPGYSLEQFKELGVRASTTTGEGSYPGSTQTTGARTLDQYKTDIAKRLAMNGQTESSQDSVRRIAKSLCGSVRLRNEAVQKAIAFKAKIGERCLSASEYDQFSTPSRDKRARELLKEAMSVISTFGWLSESNIKEISGELNACGPIEIAAGQTITLTDWALAAADDRLSSDPNQSVRTRWGLEKAQSTCPTF